ncbi:hypothetical protein MMC30_009212 [Trapelia coarctata]|nr:hypothetical protein [Trapelia coarctata]
MSESNPTNDTNDSMTPRAANRSLAGTLQGPMMTSRSHITTSGGQTGASTLVSSRFSPTAPEFVSGATAHPSRAPVDNMIQGEVSQTWHGADSGGVLLKSTRTVDTLCMPQEAPLPSLRDLPSAPSHSRQTPRPDDPPTNSIHRGNAIRDNSRNPQNSSYGNLPFQNAPYAAAQDFPQLTRAFNAHHDQLVLQGITQDARVMQDARATFDPRYLQNQRIWDSPPRRLQSLSVSPGRRDSDNSGLTNLSASASYYSSTSDAPTNQVARESIRADEGARMDRNWQASSNNNQGSNFNGRGNRTRRGKKQTEKPGNGRWKRQANSRATDDQSRRNGGEHGISARQDARQSADDSSSYRQGAEAGNNQESQARDQSLHILGHNLPFSAANFTAGVQQQPFAPHTMMNVQQQPVAPHTAIGSASIAASERQQQAVPHSVPANTGVSGVQQQVFATHTTMGPANIAASAWQQQPMPRPVRASVGVIGERFQPLAPHITMGPPMIAASGGQHQAVPSYAMTGPGPDNTGASEGQHQSAAPQPTRGPTNVRASGAQQQSIPPYAMIDPTRRPVLLRNHALPSSLVNGQKYYIKPGFRGSTNIWPYDGVAQNQLYFCTMGEDGSVNFIPTTSEDHASVQPLTTLPSSQPAPPIGAASWKSSRHPLPDFGPISPPNRGHSHGAAPGGQNQQPALSHPYNPRLEANHEGTLQNSSPPPTWSLPRSPIRTQEWSLQAPQGPQPQPQQGSLTYPPSTALNRLITTQLTSSHHGRTESETTQIWSPSRQQLNMGSTPTRSSVLDRYQVPITEIANVNPRALVPRAWMGPSSAPNINNPHVPTIFTKSWELPGVQGTSTMTSAPALPLVPYRQFQDMTFSHVQQGHPNAFGDQMYRNGRPSFEVATSPEFLPFVEATKLMKPAEWGVIKIGSIPYACTKQEILAFLGKNAKIITPEMGPAIHIMMDRTSGKTLDAYVEFLSHMDAHSFVSRLNFSKEMEHRQIKVADRHCTLEVSSQAALMKELFPKAKNVEWNGQVPVISQPGPAVPFNSGFRCFISKEELLTLAKHAESPHRSGCSSKSATRTYENMISILFKFPWFAVQHYTIGDRDAIYEAVKKQLNTLASAIVKATSLRAADPRMPPPELTEDLLGDLLHAGLNTPGFSEQQKWRLWQGLIPFSQSIARMSPLSEIWPWLALSRKPGTEEALVFVYAKIHHDGRLQPAENRAGASPLFEEGAIVMENMDQETSMEEAGALEWRALEYILRRALE